MQRERHPRVVSAIQSHQRIALNENFDLKFNKLILRYHWTLMTKTPYTIDMHHT